MVVKVFINTGTMGSVCVCPFKEVCPRKRHDLCQQRQQRGELRVVTPGCVDEENGSYVTVRLRNSISNCNYVI